MMKGAPEVAHRYKLAEFPALIRREGGLVSLFMHTGVRPEEAPVELEHLVGDANELEMRLRAVWEQIAEMCGYDEDEEN